MITGIATLFTACTKETVAVSGITLNETTLTLLVGEKETLIATISPENAGNKAFTWSSSNQEVATVSATGEVTAIKRGTATITATTIDGSKTATCTVTAKEIAVYVGGYEQNAAKKSIAKYWRNGIPVILTDGTQNAAINAIEVVGGDVYAAGYEYNVSGKSVTKY